MKLYCTNVGKLKVRHMLAHAWKACKLAGRAGCAGPPRRPHPSGGPGPSSRSACPDLFRALRCARFPTPVPPAIGTPCGKIGKTPTIRTNTYIAAPEVETTEIKCARVKWVKLMTRFKSLDGFKSITPNRFELK